MRCSRAGRTRQQILTTRMNLRLRVSNTASFHLTGWIGGGRSMAIVTWPHGNRGSPSFVRWPSRSPKRVGRFGAHICGLRALRCTALRQTCREAPRHPARPSWQFSGRSPACCNPRAGWAGLTWNWEHGDDPTRPWHGLECVGQLVAAPPGAPATGVRDLRTDDRGDNRPLRLQRRNWVLPLLRPFLLPLPLANQTYVNCLSPSSSAEQAQLPRETASAKKQTLVAAHYR